VNRRAAPPSAFSSAGFRPPKTARGRELQRVRDEAHMQAQSRWARVAKHEWAKKRVCQVLGLARWDQWNGYVPPARDPAEDRGAQLSRPNTAPQRRQVIDLLKDVQHFESTGELPAYATEPDEDDEEL
jgi:hypothetical protein